MEVYLYREVEKFIEMECELPDAWLDWILERSNKLPIRRWAQIDEDTAQELEPADAEPLLKELTALLSAHYTTEKYTFLGTCERLPIDREVREKLIDKTMELRLNRHPHYSATKRLVKLLKAQQVRGGTVMVATPS